MTRVSSSPRSKFSRSAVVGPEAFGSVAIGCLACVLAVWFALAKAHATSYPADPVQVVYFDPGAATIRADMLERMQKNAEKLRWLFRDYPSGVAIIEGLCDDRGSEEYNHALGERRARAVRDFLVEHGVPAHQLKAVSYGESKPICTEANEDCRRRNRQVKFSAGRRSETKPASTGHTKN